MSFDLEQIEATAHQARRVQGQVTLSPEEALALCSALRLTRQMHRAACTELQQMRDWRTRAEELEADLERAYEALRARICPECEHGLDDGR